MQSLDHAAQKFASTHVGLATALDRMVEYLEARGQARAPLRVRSADFEKLREKGITDWRGHPLTC